MVQNWRLLNLGIIDPYVGGHPIIETLLVARRKGLIQNTICFSVPERCVVVGCKTLLRKYVNVEYCESEGIPIIRYYMPIVASVSDGDCLFLFSVSDHPVNRNLLLNCLLKGLQSLGLNAIIKGKSNDILVNGKKICGCGVGVDRTGLTLFGAAVVVNFNYDLLENALMPTPESFANKEANSHREWVTTLKTQLGRKVDFAEVVLALKEAFESILNIEFEVSNSLTETEKQIQVDLQEKYHSEEWTKYGRWSHVKDYWRP